LKQVCGLREVLKGIRSKNIKLVIVAPNLETDGGGLDELVREVLAEAIVHQVLPVSFSMFDDFGVLYDWVFWQAHIVFALNRRKLGEAVAKKALIGVVGIRDDSGAHAEFEKVIQLSTAARESYAMMRNDPFRVLYQSCKH
jgi:ribosomal protein L30E